MESAEKETTTKVTVRFAARNSVLATRPRAPAAPRGLLVISSAQNLADKAGRLPAGGKMPNQPERCCNKLVQARIQKKKLKTLQTRLKAVTKSVDNASPRSFGLPHLKLNLKKAKMLEDQYKTIEHQNRTLLQRMSNIMENPSVTTDNHMQSYGKWSRSLNLSRRRENLDRITFDNSYLLDRLQKMEPYYKVDDWERDFQRSENIVKHMMEFDYIGPEPDAGVVPAAAADAAGARSPSKSTAAASPKKTKKAASGSSRKADSAPSPSLSASASLSSPSKGSRSPQKGKLPPVGKKRAPVPPVSDDVVEIFRFPSLALRGQGVPDSAWDISLFDSRARKEEAGGSGGGGGGGGGADGGSGGGEEDDATVLVLRGNKVTRTAVTTLALDDETLGRVIEASPALQEVFESVRGGTRAYRALGLVRGDTHLTTQLANLLLGRLRVTPSLQFVLEFDDDDDEEEEGGGGGGGQQEEDVDDDRKKKKKKKKK